MDIFFESEYLENLSSRIESFDKSLNYMKEQLTDFTQSSKKNIDQFKINFTYCHVAISKNGGLIAVCKKKGFFDLKRDSKLNKYIIVFFQDLKRKYLISIPWDNNKIYAVCVDFTPKQELFAILNNGEIYKINYNDGKAKRKEKYFSKKLEEEGIIKAKLFEKGFIAYTKFENFYYVKDIKNVEAVLMFSLPMYFKFDQNVDFIAIPADNSNSKRIEVLITRQFSEEGGLILIPMKEDAENVKLIPQNDYYFEVEGASLITKETPHEMYFPISAIDEKKKSKEKDKSKLEPPKIDNPGTLKNIGTIAAIALSPNNEKFALYSKEKKIAYIFRSDFNTDYKYKEIYFKYDKDDLELEDFMEDIEEAFEFKEGCQFIFCGDEAVALAWKRVIIISKVNAKKSLIYFSSEESNKNKGLVSKCITEVDGIRILTNDGVFLISKVPKELINLSDVFSKAATKKLIDIYKNNLCRRYVSERDIRRLSNEIPDAIMDLQMASANIYWTENNNEEQQKETQLFLLKVAQFCKKYVDRSEFNFDKFNQNCKEMRIVNNLRNDKKYPMFITYKEFKNFEQKDLISILIKYRNFQMAADVSRFLDYSLKKVLNKYIMAVMKREIKDMEDTISSKSSNEEIKERYGLLFLSLEKVPGISFVKLAKKADKYGGKKLAMYLLEQEKSDLIKIPQMLQYKDNFEEPIKIALDSYDFNAVNRVMAKIKKENSYNSLINNNLAKYYRRILLYYKIYDKGQIVSFLKKTKNYPELFYLNLKTFYKIDNFDDRIESIKLCKSELKNIEKNEKKENYDNFDVKSTKKFLEKLEHITKFKKICSSPDSSIIHYSVEEPYKVSVYDCYKNGYMKDEANRVETHNKNIEYSQKKLNLLKFRSYLEIRRPDAIDNQLQKTSLKKLGITHIQLAEIYYDYKYYDKCAETLIQVRDPSYYSYVEELFKSMKKQKEFLEFVIACKDYDDKFNVINDILSKNPGLQRFADEYCAKYKVVLK